MHLDQRPLSGPAHDHLQHFVVQGHDAHEPQPAAWRQSFIDNYLSFITYET